VSLRGAWGWSLRRFQPQKKVLLEMILRVNIKIVKVFIV
jgi:hypothetical protein